MRKKSDNNQLKKYKIKKHSLIWAIVLFLICFFLYLFCLIIDNSMALEAIASPESKKYDSIFYVQIIPIAKEFLLIFLSVIVTGFVSTFLIEIKSKNDMFSNIVVNDIFSSEYFCDVMTEENSEKLLDNLEKRKYFLDSHTYQEMYKSIREKLSKEKTDNIYYESCDFNIVCQIKDGYIEKHIIRDTKLKSFSKSLRLNNFTAFSTSQIPIEGKEIIKNIKILVDGRPVDIDIEKKRSSDGPLLDKCGYVETYDYKIKGYLDISHRKAKSIKIDIVSIVPIDDIVYTSRVKYPCKKFNLDYIVKSNDSNYSLNVTAYGFYDDGQKNVDMGEDLKSQAKVSFSDWIFPGDGVTIVMMKNS